MSYTLPRPSPYTTAPPQSPLPPPRSDGGQPPEVGTRQPPSQQSPGANYSPSGPSLPDASAPPPPRGAGSPPPPPPPPGQPPPNPLPSPRTGGGWQPSGAPAPRSDGGQSPEVGTRQPPSAFGGGLGAQHPVDVFHQMVQHPHGQAILQSLGYTPPQPQQPAALPPQRATPTVPNPGFPTPR